VNSSCWPKGLVQRAVSWCAVTAASLVLLSSHAAAQEPIRLAVIEGLSGPFANAGEAVFRNLVWAVERVNARGGVALPTGNRPLELVRFVTLHDDRMVHGSPANRSDRWRIGLTMRYSGCDVKCELSRAPWFRAYMMRGADAYRHNPQGEVPKSRFARLAPDFYGVGERLAASKGGASLG